MSVNLLELPKHTYKLGAIVTHLAGIEIEAQEGSDSWPGATATWENPVILAPEVMVLAILWMMTAALP